MPSIRSVYNVLKDLTTAQEDVLRLLSSANSNLQGDRNTAVREMKSSVAALVVPDDNARYAALTSAGAASGNPHNFSALVAQWTEEDVQNRQEHKGLEDTWGKRAEVGQKATAVKTALEDIQTALGDISPQVKIFDETTAKIAAHNKAYPKAQITAENHDKFEKFHLGRWLLWVTFINQGPQKAYQIISPYNAKYGDYYQDAADIAKVRENEKKLQSEESTHQKEYAQLDTVCNRIDTLNQTWRGPDQIAQDIRGIVAADLLKNTEFAGALMDKITGTLSSDAAANAEKTRGYDALEKASAQQRANAKKTYELLKDVTDDLQDALGRVGGESINVDTSSFEAAFAKAARISKTGARDLTAASDAIETYRPAAGTAFTAIRDFVKASARIELEDNSCTPDFSGIKAKVESEVRAYEAEQRRLREIREAEERRQREEARRRREAEEAREAVRRMADRTNHRIGGGGTSRSSGGLGGGGISRSSGGLRSGGIKR